MKWLNSQPWLRPALSLLMAVAGGILAIQQSIGINHPTTLGAVATWVAAVAGSLGAGSFGQSNSGLTPNATTALMAAAATIPGAPPVTTK